MGGAILPHGGNPVGRKTVRQLQILPNGAPADAQRLREFVFGRDSLANLPASIQNLLLKLFKNLLRYADLLD